MVTNNNDKYCKTNKLEQNKLYTISIKFTPAHVFSRMNYNELLTIPKQSTPHQGTEYIIKSTWGRHLEENNQNLHNLLSTKGFWTRKSVNYTVLVPQKSVINMKWEYVLWNENANSQTERFIKAYNYYPLNRGYILHLLLTFKALKLKNEVPNSFIIQVIWWKLYKQNYLATPCESRKPNKPGEVTNKVVRCFKDRYLFLITYHRIPWASNVKWENESTKMIFSPKTPESWRIDLKMIFLFLPKCWNAIMIKMFNT